MISFELGYKNIRIIFNGDFDQAHKVIDMLRMYAPEDAHDLTAKEQELARTNKIQAIREYRRRTGASLLDSKNAVEAYLKDPR